MFYYSISDICSVSYSRRAAPSLFFEVRVRNIVDHTSSFSFGTILNMIILTVMLFLGNSHKQKMSALIAGTLPPQKFALWTDLSPRRRRIFRSNLHRCTQLGVLYKCMYNSSTALLVVATPAIVVIVLHVSNMISSSTRDCYMRMLVTSTSK